MKSLVTFAFAALTSLVTASVALAANTLLTNPATFAYVNSTTNVSLYEHPTGIIVAGPCNLYVQSFADARAAGAEILAYVNPIDRPDSLNPCAPVQELYADVGTNLWPTPTYGQRVNWNGTHLTDIRAGGAWADHVVAYVEKLMTEDKVDGVFLDAVGARLWSTLAAWDTWSQAERDAYTAGNNDLVRRIDAKRRTINPRFIVMNNNNWDRGTGSNDPLSHVGEPYTDGFSIENHRAATSPVIVAWANSTFSNLGHRRVLAIGEDLQDALDWEDVQGVTHVAYVENNYQTASPAVIPFHRLTDRAKRFGKTAPGTSWTPGLTAFKRASKFSLSASGRLVALFAYLDGGGGGAGSQEVRLALYQDNAGVPGARVAESTAKTIAAGTAASWQKFIVTNVALPAGTYWIALQTGQPELVIRASQSSPANYYGANDLFSDGAADPYGPGFAGTTTLSLYATYTLLAL